MEHTKLSRADASAAVTRLGWRYVLGEFRTEVLTGSLPLAADVAGRAAALPDVEGHLRMDIRADRLLLSLQTAERAWVTTRDAELARQLSAVAQEFRLTTQPGDRTVQVLELAIDALDIAKIRPFWKAALGYIDEPGAGMAWSTRRSGGHRPSRWMRYGAAQQDPCRRPVPRRGTRHRGHQGRSANRSDAEGASGAWPDPRATRPASPLQGRD
jgi:hypothetical protein